MNDPSLQLGRLLSLLSSDYDGRVVHALKPYGIDKQYYILLAIAGSNDFLTQQNLSERYRLDKATVVRIIDSFEQQNLVVRLHCQSDRRVHHLKLTEKGNACIPLIKQAIEYTNNSFFEGIEKQEQHDFMNILSKLLPSSSKVISSKLDL